MAHIYQIVNDVNGKVYVGKTMHANIQDRFKEHCADSRRIYSGKRPLYDAMKKYGIEHFHIEELEEVTDISKLSEREIYWIEQKRSFREGYNATTGGEGRPFIDYDVVIATYKELHNITQTAKKLGICYDSVHNILINNDIPIIYDVEKHNQWVRETQGRACGMYDQQDKFLQAFATQGDAARYVKKHNYSTDKIESIRSRIGQVCNGKRQSAYGFRWKRIQPEI